MPIIQADFAAAVSGKKTVDSLRNAIDTELARAKIAANEAAERVRANLKLLDAQPDHLFRDIATLVHKDGEAVQAIIAGRLAEEERRQTAERERIRAEEQAKAEKAAREKVEAEARQEAAKPAQPPAAAPIAQPAPASQAVNVVPMRPQPVESGGKLALGQIGNRLGFHLTAEFLRQLGFEPAGKDRSAVLFYEAQFPLICDALVAHIRTVHAKQLQAA